MCYGTPPMEQASEPRDGAAGAGAQPAGAARAPLAPALITRRARALRWLGRHRLLLGVTLLALAVRLAWNLWIHPPGAYVYSDMAGYVARANRLIQDPLAKRVDEAFFPYGAHYLLAAVKAVFGKDNEVATASFQALMGALTVTFMTATSRRLSGRRAEPAPGAIRVAPARGVNWVPLLVGLLGAFYYPLISMSGYYLSEAPYAFFVAASGFYTLRLADEGRKGDAWLLGLVVGLGATVRPQILMGLPFLGVLWLLRRRALRPIRAGHLLRAAIPLAVILAFSAARVHYHTKRWSLVAQNGAVNRVFGRCHNVKTEATRSWFGPPSLGSLEQYEKKHPDAWFKLDPAMGLTLKIQGAMWDEHKLHALADRCVEKTGWRKQASYALTHVVLLWGYNTTWPESSQAAFRPAMRAWNTLTMVALPLPLLCAMALGLRRRFARHGLLSMYIVGLVVVVILYFGDTRYRIPYDPLIVVLAMDIYGRAGRWLLRLLPRIPRRS